jgi:putative colanic acid biosynthesis acetyltransferase WcaF
MSFDPATFAKPAFPLRDRMKRSVWNLVCFLLFRASPRPFHAWRRLLLRCCGARVGPESHVYPKAIIWAPWNLDLGQGACIGNGAEIYNPSTIRIGEYAVISQGAYLCGASHDYRDWDFPLVSKPITIGRHAWVAARAIVHSGVQVGEGCVIGAGSVVTKDMPAWSVCAGNPCRFIKPYERTKGPIALHREVQALRAASEVDHQTLAHSCAR